MAEGNHDYQTNLFCWAAEGATLIANYTIQVRLLTRGTRLTGGGS